MSAEASECLAAETITTSTAATTTAATTTTATTSTTAPSKGIVRFQCRRDICHEFLELLWRDVPYEELDYNPDCGKGHLLFDSDELAAKYKDRILSGLEMKGRE